MNNYSKKFQKNIKHLLSTYEQLKTEISNEDSQFYNQINQINDEYNHLQNHIENIYENKMMEMV